jgi:1-deoxy-D-xylulose-5-phosphate synthase
MLQWAKEQDGPVVVHVNTLKGKGYSFAEKEPGKFHGISAFDTESGRLKKSSSENFSSVFGKVLEECAAEDSRVCAVTAAMADGTGLSGFAAKYPSRFFDVAIAEGHGVAMAAGLASQGMIPVFAVYSTFLQRGYDQLIHDVALEGHHVVFGVDRAGLVGPDGMTHQGCFDALFLSGIPGFTVLCPANYAELRTMLRQALFEISGPVAVRYPRGGEGEFKEEAADGIAAQLKSGRDITLVAYGTGVNHLLKAASVLEKEGIQAEVIKLNQIAPFSRDEIVKYLGGRSKILVLEDSFGTGCVGQRIAAILAECGQAPEQMILKNLGKTFAPEGSIAELEQNFGLDTESVITAVKEAVGYGK